MDEILKAIETSNKAFAEFKSANEARLIALEKKDTARADELNEQMKKAFDEVSTQKAIIEKLEAKMTNRPGNGGDVNDKDAAALAHKAAFSKYMRKGVEYNKEELEAKSMDWTNPAEGGYLVPKVVDQSISQTLMNVSPIRQLASVIQVATTDYHHLVNLRGTQSGWVGEMAARPATNAPTFLDIVPPMGELYANPQITQQLLDDAFFDVEGWLGGQVAEEFARAENAAFLNGTGTNQPKGLMNQTFAATADDVRAFGTIQYIPSGAAAGFLAVSSTVNPADVLFTIAASLKAGYRANAKWIMPKSVLFNVSAFKDNQGRYVFSPVMAPGAVQTLLGYPVVECEDMAAMAANAYSIGFGDIRAAYLIVDRFGVRVIRDPFTNKPYIGFYTTKRVGGMVKMSEAFKVLKFALT